MVSDLLDHRLVEVTGVPLEAVDVVNVLHASEGIDNGRAEASLSKLEAIFLAVFLACRVDSLDP